jgi:hypothetical protein
MHNICQKKCADSEREMQQRVAFFLLETGMRLQAKSF